MAADNNVNNVRLMPRDEIMRRLIRMKGENGKRRDEEITLGDIATYANVGPWQLRNHAAGRDPINDVWQLIYSQLFAQIDAGVLVLRKMVDPKDRRKDRKMLVRVAKPVPPKHQLRPRIDFTGPLKIQFD